MRRLTAAIAAAVLVLFGSVVFAGGATAAPGEVTITAPGDGGEDTTPLVEGTADAGVEVHVSIDSTEVDVVTAGQDGSWSYRVTTPLPKGTTTFIDAEVRDADGAVTASAQLQYFCWSDRVELSITSPGPGEVIGPFFDVHAQVVGEDLNLDVDLLLDGEVIDSTVGFDDIDAKTLFASPWVQQLKDGPHTLQLVGKDGFNRQIVSQKVSLIGDATPPPAPVITSPSEKSVVVSAPVTIAGTAVPGQELSVVGWESGEPLCPEKTVVSDARGNWSCQIQQRIIDFASGKKLEFHITTWAYDEVGNRATSPMRAFTLDLRPATSTPSPSPSTPSPAPSSPTPDDPTGSGSAPAGTSGPGSTPASAVPAVDSGAELANTGPSTLPGTAAALALIAIGLGLTRFSRRFAGARH